MSQYISDRHRDGDGAWPGPPPRRCNHWQFSDHRDSDSVTGTSRTRVESGIVLRTSAVRRSRSLRRPGATGIMMSRAATTVNLTPGCAGGWNHVPAARPAGPPGGGMAGSPPPHHEAMRLVAVGSPSHRGPGPGHFRWPWSAVSRRDGAARDPRHGEEALTCRPGPGRDSKSEWRRNAGDSDH